MSVSNEVLLDVQGLEKAYGGNQVLNGITTQIRRGEVVAIIGPSGCGKSTFLRSLNLLEEPTGGKILFEGTDITGGYQPSSSENWNGIPAVQSVSS
jgi:polar amino acid transport system ATP-binding protein